jgi:hypothetical protein
LWAKRNPAGPGYIPCGPDDPGAGPDLNRLVMEAVWDRRRKRFVRKEDLGERRLVRHWSNQDLTTDARTIGEMAAALEHAARELRRMQQAGVVLAEDSDLEAGHAILVTTEPSVANQFGFKLEENGGGEEGAGQGVPGLPAPPLPELGQAAPPEGAGGDQSSPTNWDE